MKGKIVMTLMIVSLTMMSIFSTDSTEYGTTPTSGNVFYSKLTAQIEEVPYTLTLRYDSNRSGSIVEILTSEDDTSEVSVDLTNGDNTGYFAIVASTGNVNRTINFTTSFTFEPFSGTYDDDQTYISTTTPYIIPGSVPTTKNTNGDAQSINSDGDAISYEIPAGPQNNIQSIATFKLKVLPDKSAPAGNYSSTVTMNITTV